MKVKKILKWTVIILAVLFVAIQTIRPSRINPPIDASLALEAKTRVTPEVAAILERSCNDCHTNKTVWPWYSNVAPVSWYLVRHVNDGRRHLSFSDWGSYAPKKADRKMQEICEQVQTGEMPINSYVILHPSAKLSDADKQILCGWANQERERIPGNQPSTPQ